MAERESIVLTGEMLRFGVEILRKSDFGFDLRAETDEDLIARLYLGMARLSLETPSRNLPIPSGSQRSDARCP